MFTNYAGTDKLGDRLLGLYEYVWGSGKVVMKKQTPQYSIGPLSQKQYPDDILSDPIMREPLIKLLGDAYFSKFRIAIVVSDKLRIIDNNIVVASGCQMHDCSSNFAMFFLDIRRKLAWAVQGEEPDLGHKSARIWGIIGKKDQLLLKEIGGWMLEHQIPIDSITHMPLPASVSSLYASQRPVDVKAETFEKNGKVAIASNLDGPKNKPLVPVELFKILSPSIYVINAVRSNGDEFQGSAVAISPTVLLTNCHVVIDSSSIEMYQKDLKIKASLISADVEADRCVLSSATPLTNYVSIRPYDDLKVGERVYSIGAPAGLELTMTDGLLSGKRNPSGRRLVQNSAPISPGSSGGGLFDEAGNLIGITTFKLKDSENLNFAITAEDYLLR